MKGPFAAARTPSRVGSEVVGGERDGEDIFFTAEANNRA